MLYIQYCFSGLDPSYSIRKLDHYISEAGYLFHLKMGGKPAKKCNGLILEYWMMDWVQRNSNINCEQVLTCLLTLKTHCRQIHEEGLKHAKDSSDSKVGTSRLFQGLSINQCWGTSSHPDWRGYEGSRNHNTSYILFSISALHTDLYWGTERSVKYLVILCNKK